MQQFMQTACNDWNREKQLEMELATATASILPENNDEHMDSHRVSVHYVTFFLFMTFYHTHSILCINSKRRPKVLTLQY